MFCPLCQAEYREGFTECADCGARLVDSLESDAVRSNPPRAVWKSGGGGNREAVEVALRERGIPRRATRSVVCVLASDWERARDAISAVIPREGGPAAGSFTDSSATWVCTLCEAGYREQRQSCKDCGAALVPVEPAKGTERPRRLVWKLDHSAANRRAVDALRDAGIPARMKAAMNPMLAALALKRPTDEVWIFRRDMEAAHGVLTALSMAPDFEVEEIQSPVTLERPVLHCGLCGSEYPPGYELCPGCGAVLGDWDAPELGLEEHSDNPPELVWRGGDPVVFSCALAALRDNNIRYHVRSTADHLAFEFAMPRPKHEIRVYRSDAERARELVEEFVDPFPLVPQEPVALPTEDVPVPVQAFQGENAPSPALTTVRLLSSNDRVQVQKLREVLRDSGLMYWTTGEPPGEEVVYVHPRDEAHAHDMLREMTADQTCSLEPPSSEASYEYSQRKSHLRWGYLLLVSSLIVGFWTKAAFSRGYFGFREEFRFFRLAANYFLTATTVVLCAATVWNFYRSWGRRADKIGMLTWLFVFFGFVWFTYFIFLVFL